ncbi:MAG: hypothetical protein M3Q55_13910 [Acidobacteriota bacterium]|nr:hypothetical protein [Acidobacteriota bacterium]
MKVSVGAAQVQTGDISGRVADNTGAVRPGVTVSAALDLNNPTNYSSPGHVDPDMKNGRAREFIVTYNGLEVTLDKRCPFSGGSAGVCVSIQLKARIGPVGSAPRHGPDAIRPSPRYCPTP